MTVLDRFLRYVQYDTRAVEGSSSYPSTEGQLVLLKLLVDELREIGLTDAQLDEHGYVMATIPSTTTKTGTSRDWLHRSCRYLARDERHGGEADRAPRLRRA